MSDPRYTVIIRDNQSQPGRVIDQDLTAVDGVNMAQTALTPTNSPKSTESRLMLSFPKDTPGLNIKKKMQVWAGWRDLDTLEWLLGPTPVYGGYIRVVRERTWGGEKQMELTLDDYNILLAGTPVLGWPTFYPGGADSGYPPGYTVFDWLIGRRADGIPYDGVVRAHLGHGVRFDGVDPIYDSIFFTADVLPGIPMVTPGESSIVGHTDFVQLADVVKVIADAAYYAYVQNNHGGPELQVGYWMGAAPAGTRIVPQFCCKNIADQLAPPDFTVSDDPDEAAGELYMIQPFWHEEDSSEIMGRVVVKGRGGDETLPGTPLVYADYRNPEHAAYAPTDYQIQPGWCFKIVDDPRIHTRATALKVARVVESKLWGALGTIEFAVDVPIDEDDPGFTPQIQCGTRMRVRDGNEAIDRVYAVSEASPPTAEEIGLNRYHVRIGGARKILDDILRGGLIEQWLIVEDLAYKNDQLGQNRALPGLPPGAGLTASPTHSNENAITPQFIGAAALRIYAATQALTDAQGRPILLAPGFQTDLVQQFGPGKILGAWGSDDGRPHPVIFSMDFQGGGFRKIPFPYAVRGVRYQIQDGMGTLAFTLPDGTPISVPAVGAGGVGWRSDVAITIIVTATGAGVTAATALSVLVGEFDG